MSKRLQVLVEDKEYALLLRAAKQSGLSLGEWVRQQLRTSLAVRPEKEATAKMAKLFELARSHAFPTGDIEDIKEEIERGYRKK